MEEWKEYKLGEVTSILGDGIHGTPKYDDEGSIFFINGNNLENGHIVIKDNTKRVSYEESLKHRKPLSERTILVSINGTIGNVAKYNGEPCILGKSACFFNVNESVDLKFIYYVVANNNFKNTITRLATGTTIKNVSLKTMREYSFMMPSLPTQQKIASILSSLDDKIEVNRRINDNLEQQAQALFDEWLSSSKTYKGVFNDIIQTTLTGDWGKENIEGNYTHEVFCIRGADIPQLCNGDKGKMPIRYILEKNYKTKQLRANDLVVEISGGSPTQSTGRICMITQSLLDRLGKDVVCTNFCRAITPMEGYATFIFLYWQLLYHKNIMFSYENGTTGIKNLNISDFLSKEVIDIPTADEVKRLNTILRPIYNQIYANGLQNEMLSTLRDTLLPKLMSGELSVEDVLVD